MTNPQKTQKDIELILADLDKLAKAKTMAAVEELQKGILKNIKEFGGSTTTEKQESGDSSVSTESTT